MIMRKEFARPVETAEAIQNGPIEKNLRTNGVNLLHETDRTQKKQAMEEDQDVRA